MSDTHQSISEEIEITLKLKVVFREASFYGERTPEELKSEIESAKKALHDTLMSKIEGNYYGEDIGENKSSYVMYNYSVAASKNKR